MQKKSNTASFSSVRGKSSKVVDLSKGTLSPSKSLSSYTEYLTADNINKIKTLTYKSGKPIIDINNNIGINILYEIINRSNNSSFDIVYEYINSKQWIDENDLYFSFPEFDNARYLQDKFIETYHDERELVSGIYICKFCKSDNTFTAEKQTRAGDEASTVKIFCNNCSRQWQA